MSYERVHTYLTETGFGEDVPAWEEFMRYGQYFVDAIANAPMQTSYERLGEMLQEAYAAATTVRNYYPDDGAHFESLAWHAYLERVKQIAWHQVRQIRDIIYETLFPSRSQWGLDARMQELTSLVSRVYGQLFDRDEQLEQAWHQLMTYFSDNGTQEQRFSALQSIHIP